MYYLSGLFVAYITRNNQIPKVKPGLYKKPFQKQKQKIYQRPSSIGRLDRLNVIDIVITAKRVKDQKI
jgi:hypothetical protein